MIKKKEEESIIYQDRIANSKVKKLGDGITQKYYIWDEMFKCHIQFHPKLILPIIEEKFGKAYEENAEIEFLTTRYSVEYVGEKGQKILRIVLTDIVLKIEQKDIFHLECQFAPNGEMITKMYEYDGKIALFHRKSIREQGENKKLIFPYSTIIYFTHTGNTPDEEMLHMKLPNGNVWEYKIPVLKVQEYSLE